MALPNNTTIANWTQTQYRAITATDIASLTNEQVKAMSHTDWLLPAAVAGFKASQVPSISISWYWMNSAWLNALSAEAFAAIPTTGIIQLNTTSISGLSTAKLAALTTTQLNALLPTQLKALTTTQLNALSICSGQVFSDTSIGCLSASLRS